MQQTAPATRLSIWSKPVLLTLSALWGLMLSATAPGSYPLPLGAAAVAAVPSGLLPTTAGGALAAVLLLGGVQGIRYAAAIAVLTGVRLLFRDARGLSELFWYEPLLAGTVTLSTGLALMLGGDGNLLFPAEAVLAALCTALFKLGVEALVVLRAEGVPERRLLRGLVGSACVTCYAVTALLCGATLQGALLTLAAGLALLRARPRSRPQIAAEPVERPDAVPLVYHRMERTAEVLRELTERLKLGQDFLPATAVFASTVESLCRHCPRNGQCWDADYSTMADALNTMGAALARRGQLRESELPNTFVEHCDKRGSFVDSVNAEAALFDATRRFRDDALGETAFLREQYKSFSLVLDDLGEELTAPAAGDAALTEIVEEYFRGKGEELMRVSAAYGKHGKLRVTGSSERKPELKEVRNLVQQTSNTSLGEPELWRAGSSWHFILSEVENYSVSMDRYIAPRAGERVAGDSVRDFRTDDMKYIVALSDGMGSGRSASRKSRLAVDYLEKLMQAGLRRESATQVLNAALLVGPDPDVYATLDVAVLDLYSGDLEFVKAGAAPSYILRGSELTQIDSRSLPAGLLPTLEPEIFRCSVQPGDLIIMLSDGLLPAGQSDQPLREFITGFDRKRGSMARAMVNLCKKLTPEDIADDMTAVVLTIGKGS